MTDVPVVAPLVVSLIALYESSVVQPSPPTEETPKDARTFVGAPGAASSPPARLSGDPAAAPARAATDGTGSRAPGVRLERPESDPGVDAVRTATSRARPGEDGLEAPGARWSGAPAVGGDVAYGTRARTAVPGTSSARAGRGAGIPAAAMIVLVRDPRTGALWSLGLSSGAGVDRRIARQDGEIWVTLGPGLPRPPAPPTPPDANVSLGALEYGPPGPDVARQRVTPWLQAGEDGAVLLGGFLDADGEAAVEGVECGESCEVVVRPGLVVLGRGLAPGASGEVASAVAARALDPQAVLVEVARDARRYWPRRLGISSLSVRGDDPADVLDTAVVVERDESGRAHARVGPRHLRYLGDERIPALIEASRDAPEPLRSRMLQEAIVLGRKVARARPREARWAADLALAYTLAHPADDRALTHLREALSWGATDDAVLEVLAEVLTLRGRPGEARRLLEDALRVARGASRRRSLRAALSRLDAGT